MQVGHGSPIVREDYYGGRGTVLIWDLLAGKRAPPFTAVYSCELSESGTVGSHVQPNDAEIIIGLTGCGELRVDGVAHAFGPGALVYLPHGSRLELVNERDDAPMRYLVIKARPQPAP